jgi:hypothetical protein
VAMLRKIYAKHRGGPPGARLTMAMIREAVGVRTVGSINSWLSVDKQAHVPRGVTLDLLNAFLDRAATEPKYLTNLMKTGEK